MDLLDHNPEVDNLQEERARLIALIEKRDREMEDKKAVGVVGVSFILSRR